MKRSPGLSLLLLVGYLGLLAWAVFPLLAKAQTTADARPAYGASSGECNMEDLSAAVEQYIAAKRDEDAAKKRRMEAEERILALQPSKEEGSTTVEAGDYKVTLTGKLAYKCEDPRALAEACAGWPANLIPIKTSVALDETGCKWLRANDPQAWATVAKFVTVAPAKTAIKVVV